MSSSSHVVHNETPFRFLMFATRFQDFQTLVPLPGFLSASCLPVSCTVGNRYSRSYDGISHFTRAFFEAIFIFCYGVTKSASAFCFPRFVFVFAARAFPYDNTLFFRASYFLTCLGSGVAPSGLSAALRSLGNAVQVLRFVELSLES